jgi:uncharacterized protein GlcG (DUF336 family)
MLKSSPATNSSANQHNPIHPSLAAYQPAHKGIQPSGQPVQQDILHLQGEFQMIKLADARRIIAAAEKKAEEIKQPMNIAIVDEGGNLIAFERMENAWLGSIDIAQKKAWTSRAFDITTKDLGKNSQSGDQFFGIHTSNDCKVMIFAGGIPLKKDGKIVGAIGVSGGMGAQDQSVAEAGAAAL